MFFKKKKRGEDLTADFFLNKGFKKTTKREFEAPVFRAIDFLNNRGGGYLPKRLHSKSIALKGDILKEEVAVSIIYQSSFLGDNNVVILTSPYIKKDKLLFLHQDFGKVAKNISASSELYSQTFRGYISSDITHLSGELLSSQVTIELTNFESEAFNDDFNVYINEASTIFSRAVFSPDFIKDLEESKEKPQFELLDGYFHLFVWQKGFEKEKLEKLINDYNNIKPRLDRAASGE